MYNAEVLSKFPVVQHFPFGSLFSWDRDPNAPAPPTSVHASSQPFSLNHGVKSTSTEKVTPVRPVLPEGTKAPWATPTVMPSATSRGAPHGASRVPAATTSEHSSGPGPQASRVPFPPPTSSTGMRPPIPTSSARADQSVGRPEVSKAVSLDSMPPPTRAPWAKESGL